MLNVFNIPQPQNGFVSVFPGFANANTQWVAWEKPAGITKILIVCIGGGGGGGSGFPSATTTSRGGGGGGGSSTLTSVSIQASFLPDVLYVSAGIGGNGGASSTTVSNPGGSGIASYVSIAQSNAAIYSVCSALGGGGGGASAGAGAGPAGVAAAATGITAVLMAWSGILTSRVGQAGAAGGSINDGEARTYLATGLLLSGGAGGAGNFRRDGGAVSPPASQTGVLSLFQTRTGGVRGDPGAGGPGFDGVSRSLPLLSCGGAGGGSSFNATDAGGGGGTGGFGSGGGGGGAGGTTGGGGAGGNGGPGLVLIYSW